MAILDTGSPVNVISSKLMKKIKLAPDLEYNQDFGTAGPNNTRTLGAYSSLHIHIGKLILLAPVVALDNNANDMLIGTQFMIEYEGIINMKQGLLSLLNYEVPLVLANKEPSKKEYSCMIEYPLTALPIHYTTSGKNTKNCMFSVDAAEGIPFYAADEVVIKPGEQRVVDTKITLKIPRHCLLHLSSIDRISPVEPQVLPGVLDPAYLRHITLLLGNLTDKDIFVRKHQEVGQGFLLPVEEVEQIHSIGSMADLGLPKDNLVCTLPNVHILDELTSDELEKVHTLLDEYSDIFSKLDNDYGHMKG